MQQNIITVQVLNNTAHHVKLEAIINFLIEKKNDAFKYILRPLLCLRKEKTRTKQTSSV